MVEIKLRGNDIYESACLVLKNADTRRAPNEHELVDEAKRIISELGVKKRAQKPWHRILVYALMLLLGILFGFTVGVML